MRPSATHTHTHIGYFRIVRIQLNFELFMYFLLRIVWVCERYCAVVIVDLTVNCSNPYFIRNQNNFTRFFFFIPDNDGRRESIHIVSPYLYRSLSDFDNFVVKIRLHRTRSIGQCIDDSAHHMLVTIELIR